MENRNGVRVQWKTAKGTNGKPRRVPVENRNGDQRTATSGDRWEAATGAVENGKPEPMLKPQRGPIEICKGASGKREVDSKENFKGGKWKTAKRPEGNRKEDQ